MTQALPPRRPRRGGWLTLVLTLGWLVLVTGPDAAWAQQGDDPAKPAADAPKGKGDGKSKADAKDKGESKGKDQGKADEDDDDGKKQDEDVKKLTATETVDGPDRWEDPRAEAAMANTFPELPSVSSPDSDKKLIEQLAKGQGNSDMALIDRYVKNRASVLTKKANIKALLEPGAKGGADPKALEKATRDLIDPLLIPASSGSKSFREAYVKKMVEVFEPIWSGHLHSRTMAMIVLSRSGEPVAFPTFAAQIKNPDQLAIVKLLAAVGASNVAQEGRKDVDDSAVPVAKALAGFLTDEKDTFWPARFRAVEALGSLRIATERQLDGKAEFALVLLNVAADPKEAPTVRAWAAWALGMIRIPGSARTYNFPLVANVIGQVAADIGSKVAEQPDSASKKMSRLANMLAQLHFSLVGDPNVRASGLVNSKHVAAATAQPYVAEVEKRVRAVAKASFDLTIAAPAQMKDARATLLAADEDLRSFLAKPLQGGRVLYPGAAALPGPNKPGAPVEAAAAPARP